MTLVGEAANPKFGTLTNANEATGKSRFASNVSRTFSVNDAIRTGCEAPRNHEIDFDLDFDAAAAHQQLGFACTLSRELRVWIHSLHSRRLYKTILSITKNPHDAEEALQDTFLRAYFLARVLGSKALGRKS
jgi:Sigma-70 region 2